MRLRIIEQKAHIVWLDRAIRAQTLRDSLEEVKWHLSRCPPGLVVIVDDGEIYSILWRN